MALLSFAFVSCSSNKKTDAENKEAAVKSMTTPPVDEKEKKTEELKKAPQLTLEQIRMLLPAELNGVREKNYQSSTQFGYGLATAEYPKSKTKGIKVTLYDCAGESGYVNYFENYWNHLNSKNETETEFKKTIDFEGGKAIETYKKDMNLSTLTFVVRGRLIVVLEGKNMEPGELEAAAKQLHAKIA
jgi:predicted ribonuclease toxin of YeeF-YezG toxin-antitoxin module